MRSNTCAATRWFPCSGKDERTGCLLPDPSVKRRHHQPFDPRGPLWLPTRWAYYSRHQGTAPLLCLQTSFSRYFR